MNKVLPRWAVCAFFAVFLALGLLTAADYGPSWDEQTEMDILRMNLWEYARVLGRLRSDVGASGFLIQKKQTLECLLFGSLWLYFSLTRIYHKF